MNATQSEPYLLHKIQYTRNITSELVELRKKAWKSSGMHLVSAILSGPLAVGEYDENIDLWEIVRGFPDTAPPFSSEFVSARQFPMYGRLKLHTMNPKQFKNAIVENSTFVGELRSKRDFLFDEHDFAKKLLK